MARTIPDTAAIRRPRRLAKAGLALGISMLALGACAVAAPPIWDQDDRFNAPYGDYLAAVWADSRSDPEQAARFYRRALEKDPENPMLTNEAFRATLLAAEWTVIPALAEAALTADPANDQARLALAADAMADGQWRRAARLLEQAQFGPLDNITASVLLAWSLAATGDEEGALESLAQPEEAALFSALIGLHQAMLFDMAGEDRRAEIQYQDALDSFVLPSIAAREYGRWLEREGRRDDARALYSTRLDANPGDVMAANELERLDSRGRADRMDPADASALALFGAAAALAGRDFSDRSQIYLELALRLDDDFAAPRILLGRIMHEQGRDERAAELFEDAADSPDFAMEARIRRAQLEAASGQPELAEEMLRDLWRESGDETVAAALAESLRVSEDWAEAEDLLTHLIDARAERGEEADWTLLYRRAVVRERQGEWPEAEADFRAAIELNPGNASLLNYLGYAMVDRGENLEEAFSMIRRAVAMAPREGYIVDSLGWAYYKLGDFDEAVLHLERAAALDPGAADINDHLGDAYWRVGRRLEARFQWERALSLDPEGDLQDTVQAKLADGLPPLEDVPAMAENQ